MDAAARPERILIVDDESVNIALLEGILKLAGYTQIVSVGDSRDAVATFKAESPDVVLLDLIMPPPDGFDVMTEIRRMLAPDEYVPILVLTADATTETRQRALARGATDFVLKPFDAVEVLLRIQNLLCTRMLHVQLASQNEELERRVRARTRELDEARLETLERLALAAEYRDDDTHEHTMRVGANAARIGELVGMTRDDVEVLRRAAPLHDIGKIGVSDSILLKPGKLSADEFETVKAHTKIGQRILSGSTNPTLRLGEEVALRHHERWDGNGYPDGLAGERILLAARIVSIVDVFDALTHERPYKHAWPVDAAAAEIERMRGSQFDPLVVDEFIRALHEGTVRADPEGLASRSIRVKRSGARSPA